MKYRMYCKQIEKRAALALALALQACAYTPSKEAANRQPDSVQTDEEDAGSRPDAPGRFDGREPAGMRGDFTWLNEVESEFGRVAAETSSRALAGQNKQEILMKQKDWAFGYLPRTNHFYVTLQGTQYQMVQTKIDDGGRFAFAAEGQSESPVTFAVTRGEGRSVASGDACSAEISYWSKSAKSYVTERKSVAGRPCARMLGLLKDYVP